MSEGHAPALLLCTDLDRTLVPNGPQPESPGARELFARLVARPELSLVFVSGRDRGRVEEGMREWSLPAPDLVVADVGSTIYDRRGGTWERWAQWDATIASDWGPHDHAALAAALADMPELRLQEASRQGRFKLSYEVELEVEQGPLDAAVAARLGALGVKASRIWSVDEAAGVGLLDVLPARATKRHAVDFVREALGMSLSDTVFAGDSGNDLAVMASPIPSVLVANARPEVTAEASRLAEVAGTLDALYLARGGWRGLNGCYAAGILEGVAHYHPERVAAWLGDAS